MSLLIYSTSSSVTFATRLASRLGASLAPIVRETFPDGEHYLRVELESRIGLLGKDVVLVGATDSQNSIDDLYRLGCLASKYGARSLVLVIPYFGYSTMERGVKPGEVVTAKTIARQLSAIPRAVRGNWIVLLDLHSAGIVHYFEGDTVALELYAEPVILRAIESLGLGNLCLASTDMGRAKWVESLANKLHAPLALIHKKRLSGSETKVHSVVGDVSGCNVVLYDDMIRTGGSLVQAAEAYLQAGAKGVYAAATHLVLPEPAIERLRSSPLSQIIGTDSHPRHRLVALNPRFSIASVVDLFADVVSRLAS